MGLAILTSKNLAEAEEASVAARRGRGGPSPAPDPTPAPAPAVPDDQLGKIVKLIPGEVTAFYLAVMTFLAGGVADRALAMIVFGLGLLATPAILRLSSRRTPADPAVPQPPALQYVLRTIAFALWALAVHNPFAHLAAFDPRYVGVALMSFTLFAGYLIPSK